MSKTIPKSYAPPSLTQYTAGEQILVDVGGPRPIIRNLHQLWSRVGARGPILLMEDNPFQTSSLALTTTDEGATGFDLTRVNPALELIRPVLVGGSLVHRVRMAVYGRDVAVAATLYAPDGNATLGTLTVTRSSTSWGWSSATLDLTRAQVGEGGVAGATPRLIGVSIEARAVAALGEMWQVVIGELVANNSSYLPDGEAT